MADQSYGAGEARIREQSYGGPFSRSSQRVANNLGIIEGTQIGKAKKFRKPELELFDAYYEGRQYAGLSPWYAPQGSEDNYIPIRMRQPLIKYDFPKTICDRVAAKIVGYSMFPNFKVEDEPETEALLKEIIKQSKLKSKIMEPMRRMLAAGSSFLRFSLVEGQLKLEHYLSKYCYPKFDSLGHLESIRIQYIYDDEEDRNAKGDPKKKWYRLDLEKMRDVLYDNPEFSANADPQFSIVAVADHGLGFVQGEWFRTAVLKHCPDGPSLFEGSLCFFDELNYSLSQSSQAIMYNQDPQMTITGVDEDELEKLIKSSMKAWNLGKEGKAEFLESNLGAVERAIEFRDKIRLAMQDVSRVVLLDPEKMIGQAQSGKAMEILHGPMVELIDEMRPELEDRLISIVLKMYATIIHATAQGIETSFDLTGYQVPENLNVGIQWNEIFPKTLEDLQKKISIANSASSAQIISRDTAMRWVAKDFGIEDIEAELEKIAAQPVLNPFGGF